MKLKNILPILPLFLLPVAITGCEDEKDLIIIEGELPIKTSTLYMVGDATPNGWSIDSPTQFTRSDEDPLVFTWEGALLQGEMKLCLTTGSWDAPFIRPEIAGTEINRTPIGNAPFKMHAGDPDDKWNVTEAGVYSLRFDLRNRTMSSTFLREPDAPVIEPIVADNLYLVGDFNGWNIDSPTSLEKKSDYLFVYEGPLTTGELKACLTPGSWDVPFIRPQANNCLIDKNGVENPEFIYTTGPDFKWKVAEDGLYRLTFDLEHWTLNAEYTGFFKPAPKLYMIGEATDGGWSWDAATVIEATPDNDKLFIWEGELGRGTFKASEVKDFGAPFYRPETPDCEISETGVASGTMVFTESPDDQWLVIKAGKYRLTFDTANMTFDAKFLEGSVSADPLYLIGDATPGGWSQDEATSMTPAEGTEGVYKWTGTLKTGNMKAFVQKDPTWSQNFYRPSRDGVKIYRSGAEAADMVFTNSPDDQWHIIDEGKYEITMDIKTMTFVARFIE